MKFSKNWLLEWCNPNKNTEELCAQLTNVGLEVDFHLPATRKFSGVVVAEIVDTKPHPNAEKLQICLVNDGGETLQIVCGAKNARIGLKVALAKINAVLPGDFKIKKAKLRGVESFGMLCSKAELSLADNAEGILELDNDAPIGEDIRIYLQLDDDIIDIDLTPNRGDCLSIKGLSRELSAINNSTILFPEILENKPSIVDTFDAMVMAPQACPRYCTRIIRSVDLKKNSPLWLQEKLRRSEIRSINAIVDVTNYVMLELGQPMHAFDLKHLRQPISVRFAKQDEMLTLLDDSEIKLTDDVLMIADAKKPLALAGIMGGVNSGVSSATNDIVLESAFFAPLAIMGKARRYGLHTDSSHRFERGVDPNITILAMQRATQLILAICGGEAGPVMEKVSHENLPKVNKIHLRRVRISRILGIEMTDDKIVKILQGLQMKVDAVDDGWQVTTPSYRFDLGLEIDLIEEIARIYGFQHIPSKPLSEPLIMLPASEKNRSADDLRNILLSRGYHETLTYSFVDAKLQSLLLPKDETIALQNPISTDMGVMRTSLWINLVQAVLQNQQHQEERVRLFEIGCVYFPEKVNDNFIQPVKIAGVIAGTHLPEQWAIKSKQVDFYDIKADVEALLGETNVSFLQAEHVTLHPGQSAQIIVDKQIVGWLGALHPRISQTLKIAGQVFLFELNLTKIEPIQVKQYRPISKYPSIRRDLSIVIDEGVTFQQVYDIVEKSADELLVSLKIFDIYKGKEIKPDQKSMALAMTFQHSNRTLVDKEVVSLIEQIINNLRTSIKAELRG